MKAESRVASSWFEDDATLEGELRHAIGRRDPAPAIRGYEDLREIGEGGQGVVYVATQTGTRRRVAVKVLRERFASAPEARRRFEREIDLAAGLRHPHIVAVFDGGVTPDGRPYLVMEFVEGAAIDASPAVQALRACWSRPNLEAVLRAFATVCDGVHHAHQRGVIHRDLKPSNIRVDSDGVARVLDFGLAKTLGPSQAATVTAEDASSRRFIGSLPWASPEQAAGRADAIDVRSEVYALGVTLYQLLTGRFPYDVSGDLHEALHNIVATQPVPPTRWAPGLDSDLVTIVLRALAKEPDRRYQSAGDFAADVRAWLAHEPIAARRDSLWYLVRVTARRRKGTLLAAAVFLVALAASAVVSFVEWRSAERSAKTSSEALDLLLGTVFTVDPDAEGKDARVIDGLEKAARELDSRFEDEPSVRATLHRKFSSLFDKLGRPQQAVLEAEKGVAILRQVLGEEDEETLAADAERAFFLHKAGRSAEAAADLQRIREAQKRILGAQDLATLATADHLSRVLVSTGRFKDAETMQVDALATARARLGPDHDTSLDLLEGLSHARRQLGDLESSETLQREAYERRKATRGADHTSTLNALGNLVVVLTERNKLGEAELLQKGLYETSLQKLGPEHPAALTNANTYAKILQDLGRYAEAAPLFETVFEVRERVLGADHKDTLLALANLAGIRSYQGNHVEAERLLRKSLAARLRVLGPKHLETLVNHNNLAGALKNQDRHEEALESYGLAVKGAEEALGHDHWISALFRANMASTLTKLGRLGEARTILVEALGTIEKKLGASHVHAKTGRQYLAALEQAQSRPAGPESRR
jgi:non-specific serine/threonine protein kinase/serine/threonine-protein kinase